MLTLCSDLCIFHLVKGVFLYVTMKQNNIGACTQKCKCVLVASRVEIHSSDAFLHAQPLGHNPAVGDVEMLFAECVRACMSWCCQKHVTRVILFTLHLSTLHPCCATFY